MAEGETQLGSRQKLLAAIRYMVCILAGVFVLWLTFVLYYVNTHYDIALPGIIGDSMAVFGSLATASALGIAAYSLVLQREDLSAQLAEQKRGVRATEALVTAQERDLGLRKLEALARAVEQLEASIESVFTRLEGNAMHLSEAAWNWKESNDGRKMGRDAIELIAKSNDLRDRIHFTLAKIRAQRHVCIDAIAREDASAVEMLGKTIRELELEWTKAWKEVFPPNAEQET